MPTPTGGWWMGEFRPSFQKHVDTMFVIGDRNHSCERIGWPSIVTYQILSYHDENTPFEPASSAANGDSFFLLKAVCNLRGLELSFTPDPTNTNLLSKSFYLSLRFANIPAHHSKLLWSMSVVMQY
jgi:hypothetical protein